jgi:hypothetical protein
MEKAISFDYAVKKQILFGYKQQRNHHGISVSSEPFLEKVF